MIPNNSLVTPRMGKILSAALVSGLLLTLISPLPSVAENVSEATAQKKTTELVEKCQQRYGLNSEHPDKEALKKCLGKVLKACQRHTNGNAQLCKQWIKDALE